MQSNILIWYPRTLLACNITFFLTIHKVVNSASPWYVISHFPKNRLHNRAMLLLFISKQAEPAFLSKITIGQSQQPIKGKVFHRSSEIWSWAHSHFTLGLLSIETSKLQIQWNLGADIGLAAFVNEHRE